MDQATALEEGVLAVNAAAIVFAALTHVDDATFCYAPESWFDAAEVPFEVFHFCHPGGVLCNVNVSRWPPHGSKPSPLESD